MHLGVPCLISDLVGCQRDLITPGETGWVFPANDPASLAATLVQALRSSPEELRQLGAAALLRAASYTYEQTTAGLLSALASLA